HGVTGVRVADGDSGPWTVISALVRFPADRAVDQGTQQQIPTVVCWQPVSYGGEDHTRLRLSCSGGRAHCEATTRDEASNVRTTAAWGTNADTGDPPVLNLHDGAVHHVAVAMRPDHPSWLDARLWVDGREVP